MASDMIEKRNIDDRSMGEILASIRKIVTHEETARRNGGGEERASQAEAGAGPLILTYDMRVQKQADESRSSPKAEAAKDAPSTPSKANLNVALDSTSKASADVSSAAMSDGSEAVDAPIPVSSSPVSPSPVLANLNLVADKADEDAAAQEVAEPAETSGRDLAGLSLQEVEALIRRVVREELQGPVGKQINRKVKRMVRDEVSAAMDDDSIL